VSRVELEWLTPLHLADPPGELLRRLYNEARESIRSTGGTRSVLCATRQTYLRRVSVEYGKRLAQVPVFVEGETDV